MWLVTKCHRFNQMYSMRDRIPAYVRNKIWVESNSLFNVNLVELQNILGSWHYEPIKELINKLRRHTVIEKPIVYSHQLHEEKG